MNQSQKIFGEPAERPKEKVRPYMVRWVQDFIRNSPFMVMASSADSGLCDASPKGGKPGFVKVLDETHLVIPDVAGNKLFQTYENLEANPHVGLVFFIPSVNATVRVNGRVKVLRKGEPEFDKLSLSVFQPDENAKLLQALLLEVIESYSHCPLALGFSKLWSTEIISENTRNPPIEQWVAET
jgi:predicted pyridoxine 5'-phosphate oxidase superfamily flavin-nucleotide-binding protein